jgi:hypothetical protein
LRTRPRSPSPSRPLRVNVVSSDGLLRQSLRALECRFPILLVFSDGPLSASEADAYVVSAYDLKRVIDPSQGLSPGSPTSAPLVLAFGRGEHLRGAFLAGCDDYLKEPWEPDELAMRLERLARRREERRVAGGWELMGRRMKLPDGREVELSAHEAVVAGLLLANRGAVVSRRALSVALWGRLPPRPSRAVDMHISALRRKLGRDSISCVRGQGYVVD